MATKNSPSRKQAKMKKVPTQKKRKIARSVKKSAPRGGASAPAPRGSARLADSALVTCPTRQYSGTVLLDDANGQSFLQMGNATFLLMLDRGCTGVLDPQNVTAAYEIVRVNPGRNGVLTCQGFLHQDGTATVLHVVS